MSEHSVVMTFPISKWKEYGQHCVPSFDTLWPKDTQAYIYLEGEGEVPYHATSRVNYIDYSQIRAPIDAFEERNKDKGIADLSISPIGNIEVQAAKFARKVFAQLDQLKNPQTRFVWYLDADCKTLQPLTEHFLNLIVKQGQYVSYIDRPRTYTETGLIVWDTQHPEHKNWLKLYEECYTEDKIFQYDAWHDCIAFDHATKTMLHDGKFEMFDLGFGMWKYSNHPLVAGPLGKYFDHLKGPSRKNAGVSKERLKFHPK
jgi:hypothetical protein